MKKHCPVRKSGNELFCNSGSRLPFDLRSFWQWSASDLLGNTLRGILAEYLVAQALGIAGDETIRLEWEPYDLRFEGTKIEVKSAGYVQSWHQSKNSSIVFRVGKKRSWNRETNELAKEKSRQADIYVFAVLHHIQRDTIDPMNVDQWEFYVVRSDALDERTKGQQSISLRSLRDEFGPAASFNELRASVILVRKDFPPEPRDDEQGRRSPFE